MTAHPTISQIGEMALLKKIEKWCRPEPVPHSAAWQNGSSATRVPLGDDAYVVKLSTGGSLVFTTDTLLEGTHFNFRWLRSFLREKECWRALGRKAIAVSLSDLAAMGEVQPLFALITIGLNGDISVNSVDNLYTEIRKMAKEYGFTVAGGDTIRSDKSMLSIVVCGKLTGPNPITRSGADPGDIIMANGPLGLSSAGLKILSARVKIRESWARNLLFSHICPEPKLKEGKILAGEDIVATSLIDTSDDLVTSLEILSARSGVGIELNLENVPVHPHLAKFCKKFGLSPYHFILYGGEDYQLIFTVRPEKVRTVQRKIPSAYILGLVKEKSFGIQVKINGKPFRIRDSRFKHF